MDTDKYLQRIGLEKLSEPNLQQLFLLQQQHLLHIPFENLDIHLGKEITLDYKAIFKKVIEDQRGGFCYELNGLFYFFLEKIGYSVKRISARVLGSSGQIGKEYDHLAIIVEVEKESWLVDVGFGKFSFQPLKIELGQVQGDGRQLYKINKYDDAYHGVYTKEEKEDWRLGYLFSLEHRAVSEFAEMCHHQQTSPDTNFTKRRMITKPRLNGRVTLTDTKLKITEAGMITEQPIHSELDFQKALKKYFQMNFEY